MVLLYFRKQKKVWGHESMGVWVMSGGVKPYALCDMPLTEFFFHDHMRDGDFNKLTIIFHVSHFFIEAGRCDAGMHLQGLITHVAGYIFGKNHQSASDSLALKIIWNRHLA